MKRISITILIVTLVAAVAIAAPRGRRGSGPQQERSRGEILPPQLLAEFLGLTDAQTAQVEPLRETLRATIEPLREQKRANHDEIRAAIEAGDTAKAGELLAASHNLTQQMKAAHDAYATAFEALLTSEQKAKWAVYDEIAELRRQRAE